MTDEERIDAITRHSIELTIQTEDGCRCGSCKEWVAEAYWDTMETGHGENVRAAIDDFIEKNKKQQALIL